MAEVIRMPLLSDTMTEGVIAEWHKKVGDTVKSDDVIAEVETDKATMEVMAYADGTLLYIGVEKGQAAKVNGIIAIVGKAGEDYKPLLEGGDAKAAAPKADAAAPAPKAEKAEATPAAAAVDNGAVEAALKNATVIRMPLLSDTMTEGKIVTWNKKEGDTVKSDDVLAEVETDKATMEVIGYADGTLLHIGVPEGQVAKVNGIIAIVGKKGTDISPILNAEKSGGAAPKAAAPAETTATATAPASAEEAPAANGSTDGRVKASPLAKKLAEDKGIDIRQVTGTGDGGRIIKADVDSFVPSKAAPAATPSAPGAKAPAAPVAAFAPIGQEGHTDTPVSQMRKAIARRLAESKFGAPHFYLTMEINMDEAMKSREAINKISPVKVSFNDMVIKAAAMALRQHPDVNSSWMGDSIRHNQHIHIGSAVAVEEGLIVPVIRFADQKSFSQIAAETKTLNDKAKNKKLQPNDYSGNTFTVSNLGMMGIEHFTAIINPPDSAILAVGAIKETVIVENGQFKATNVMKVTMSCDHRTVDGAVGARFLVTFKQLMENPVTMLV
ncbi:pyruvate dehydrogenase complex dihydrolipoamide acetyltransferase [Chitinophaga sp. SYP-B3965]|uniref:pyruvate dehydrogenase complex dihydrolipoamide acetyltransferase n=1 Tax=Chitinophaga sp. SYP-B3965 TaxID=2663120 RepID=UPI0012998B51|nr:pyruvate dehydrogenase complex dihydrolipoamide acetyltransferase [Chitinophaga sp. SYP-B3965]MRG47609.1 pyruvate dehydrogenase complex dihydrolipoamide acetyltransferase [Chitinophaga sp. SYP-B3965]